MTSSPTETERADGAAGPTPVVMPQMGISVAEGTIATWLKAPGDTVADGETICEVTTDKIDVEIPAPAAGVLGRIVAETGETVAVGEPIAEIAAPGADAVVEEAAAPDLADPGSRSETDRSGFVSPVVRRMAAEHDIDLDRIEGTGIGGRIRKRDLVAHLAGREAATATERPLHSDSPYVPEPAPDPPAPVMPAAGGVLTDGSPGLAEASGPASNAERSDRVAREPMSPMRLAIGKRMVESLRTSAQCTTVAEVDMGAVMAARAERGEAMSARGVALTPLAFVARAVVEALAEFPVLNASIEGDELVHHDDVDLGIAVAVDQGLVVPVIRRAQHLGLEGMAVAIGEVAGRARRGALGPEDMASGTFTITNPGRYGAVMATPIINQPQVAILDLEAIVKRAVVRSGEHGDSIAIRPIAYLPMSWDHRALDGVTAARFLGSVRERLEGGGW